MAETARIGAATGPRRIQRKRTKGYRLPADAIYVGRPTRWGNLWRVGLIACGCRSAGECPHNSFRAETAADAVEAYRYWLGIFRDDRLAAFLAPLRGHDLACWCPLVDKDGNPVPCHADVLIELSNRSDNAG